MNYVSNQEVEADAEKAVDAHVLTKTDKHDRLLNPEVMAEKGSGIRVGEEKGVGGGSRELSAKTETYSLVVSFISHLCQSFSKEKDCTGV